MVERQRPEANRRSVALTIAANGRQAVEGYVDGYRASCKAMLQALDPVDRREFLRLTQKIAKFES
ncbi:hypothetical protein D3C87_2073430 [compost metagenome]